MTTNNYVVKFDGAVTSQKEPSLMGQGVVIYLNGELVCSVWRSTKQLGTNNDSEWLALMIAMKSLLDVLEHSFLLCSFTEEEITNKVTILGDSQLIINQFLGKFNISEKFEGYAEISNGIATNILQYCGVEGFDMRWIPREENKEADKLSKTGLAKSQQGYEAVYKEYGRFSV